MSSVYDLVYNCGPVSKQFHQDKESRVKLLIGPFGTGKTTSAAYDVIELQSKRVLETQGKIRSRFAIVRNTFPELRDTTIKTYLDWFPPGVFGSYNQSNHIYKIAYDGREIEIIFKALDTQKDVRDLLSLELTGAHVDEAREIHPDVIKGLLGRVGRFPSVKDTAGKDPFLTPPQVVLTTNYPSREHFLYQDFVGEPIPGYQIYEQSQEENKHNLRPGYYEDLEHDYKNRPDLLRTLVRGEWGITVKGKEVYPEFNKAYHVADEPLLPLAQKGVEYDRKIVRGWDNTGLSPACIITYINSLGQWFWIKEFCGSDIGMSEFAEMVTIWCAENFPTKTKYIDIGDPGGNIRDTAKKNPAQYIYESTGIVIQSGIQTFKVRRESIANLLRRNINGEPALIIDASCTRVIDGFEGGYCFPEIGNTGYYKPEPEKNIYSHIHDAGQYPATILFPAGPQVEEIPRRDDYVSIGRNEIGGY